MLPFLSLLNFLVTTLMVCFSSAVHIPFAAGHGRVRGGGGVGVCTLRLCSCFATAKLDLLHQRSAGRVCSETSESDVLGKNCGNLLSEGFEFVLSGSTIVLTQTTLNCCFRMYFVAVDLLDSLRKLFNVLAVDLVWKRYMFLKSYSNLRNSRDSQPFLLYLPPWLDTYLHLPLYSDTLSS